MRDPKSVVQVGKPGDKGCIELSDFIVGTQDAQAGAVGIVWNIKSPDTPSCMWAVDMRMRGSNLQLVDCPATPGEENAVSEKCIGAHISMHVTKSVEGLYMENVWLRTADHDLDNEIFTNITVYSGRGLSMQANKNVWLYVVSSPNHRFLLYSIAPSLTNIPQHWHLLRTPLPLPIPFLQHPLRLRRPDLIRKRLLTAQPTRPRTLRP